MNSRRSDRETLQLWHAARLYYELLPDSIADEDLAKTVRDWSEECQQDGHFYERQLFVLSAHIDSCAIRLYSIDELMDSQRYRDYRTWWKDSAKAQQNFTRDNTHHVIHCVIRHLVCHHEKDRETHPSHKLLTKYYEGLTFGEILEGIRALIGSMAAELGFESYA